ncbi:hypothetical protein J22TS3_13840 [Paenibacillus sp. J22TS3]|nr:hypothetical protein J22TS3_13840 [Paenibacillus sp. J22TS3]
MKNGWYLLGTDDFVGYREYGPTDIEGGTGHVLEIDGCITCSTVYSRKANS